MKKSFYDLDAYDDYDIVQEGTEIGSLDFKFDDDVVEESTTVEESEKEVIQEAEEPSDDDTVKEAIEKENAPEEETKEEEPRTEETIEEDKEVSTEEETPKAEEEPSTEDALSDSETPEGDDLSDFGTDTSDVQNEYDPKEIEILNKLIAAEGEAINDYFDASKDSHDSNARRLYSDIGHEERFHMEQLLFQKAQFTGEKYEPRDPEVKKEYEELLQMGMDDETAMNTAIDKQSVEGTDDGDDSDVELLGIQFETALTLLRQNEILVEAAQHAYDKRGNKEIFENYSVITEAYLYQEEVINTASVPKEVKKIPNPISLLIKGLKAAVNGLLAAGNAARDASEANRIKRKRKLEWIKKNGITGLFASGVSFYFYDADTSTFDMTRPVQYVDMLYRLSIAIGKQCGIQPKKEAYHGTIKDPIKFGTIGEGMAKIKTLQVSKTKIVVNENNKESLTNEFFGYNEQKINVRVWNAEANKAIYQSNNVYTKLQLFAVITNQYLDITLSIMEVLEKLQGDMNSIYYKNRQLYNNAVEDMKIIATTYRKLINACVSDLAEMNKFDKSVLDATHARDTAEQTGQKWEGEDRRTSGSMAQQVPNENQYAKQKKR